MSNFIPTLTILICIDFSDSRIRLIGHYEKNMYDSNHGMSNEMPNFSLPSAVPEKPFTCMTCYRSYKYKSSLKLHLKYECGKDKQFRCSYCQRLFGYKHSLRRHVFTVHKQLE